MLYRTGFLTSSKFTVCTACTFMFDRVAANEDCCWLVSYSCTAKLCRARSRTPFEALCHACVICVVGKQTMPAPTVWSCSAASGAIASRLAADDVLFSALRRACPDKIESRRLTRTSKYDLDLLEAVGSSCRITNAGHLKGQDRPRTIT